MGLREEKDLRILNLSQRYEYNAHLFRLLWKDRNDEENRAVLKIRAHYLKEYRNRIKKEKE